MMGVNILGLFMLPIFFITPIWVLCYVIKLAVKNTMKELKQKIAF